MSLFLTPFVVVGVGALATLGVVPATADAASCPNESLRYGHGANLPDCRAYEQASPIDKNGTNAQATPNDVQAAEGGGGITFFSQAGVPGGTGAGQLPTFLSTRDANGWSTQGLLPPATTGQITNVKGWTPTLAETFDEAELLGTGVTLLARDNADGSLQTIVPHEEYLFPKYGFVGASSDGGTVYFEEADGNQLTPEAVAGEDNLYVWDRASGALSLVGVLPSSTCGTPPCVPAGGSFGGAYNWWDGGTEALVSGGANDHFFTQAQHVISADGQRAYFTTGQTGQLYLRENATSPDATTVSVSASRKTNGAGSGGTDPNGPQPAAFMMATPDGSQAFFTSKAELTNDANTGPKDQGNDLYRFEPESGKLADLTPDVTDLTGADVLGVLGVSEDGSYVYFAANGDLDGTGPAQAGNCQGESTWTGECSLYLWHDGTVKFVVRLDASGTSSYGGPAQEGRSDAANWAPRGVQVAGNGDVFNTSRVGTGGQVLLFRSQAQLTEYENDGVPEFYRYDAATGRLTCVSCNPSGATPTSNPTLQTQTSFFGYGPLPAIQTRNLSASGDQFFFETRESLLSSDKNNTTDVYEWELDGAGSCQSAADGGGCLYLLSTGTSADASHFADASSSGEEAFFFTSQPLVGQDQDELVDVYDARVDGGLASQRAQANEACSGEGCKRPAGPPLAAALANSQTFAGAGDVRPPASKQQGCATLTKRVSRLQQRLRTLRTHAKKLQQRSRQARRHGQRAGARRFAREVKAAGKAGARLAKQVRQAEGKAKRCRAAKRGGAK